MNRTLTGLFLALAVAAADGAHSADSLPARMLDLKATAAKIEHGGDRAFYRPSTDHIQMPGEGLFTGTKTMTRTEGYYATLVHELVHNAAIRIMPSTSRRRGWQHDRGEPIRHNLQQHGSTKIMSENMETCVDPHLDSFAESFAVANYKAATITSRSSGSSAQHWAIVASSCAFSSVGSDISLLLVVEEPRMPLSYSCRLDQNFCIRWRTAVIPCLRKN